MEGRRPEGHSTDRRNKRDEDGKEWRRLLKEARVQKGAVVPWMDWNGIFSFCPTHSQKTVGNTVHCFLRMVSRRLNKGSCFYFQHSSTQQYVQVEECMQLQFISGI